MKGMEAPDVAVLQSLAIRKEALQQELLPKLRDEKLPIEGSCYVENSTVNKVKSTQRTLVIN